MIDLENKNLFIQFKDQVININNIDYFEFSDNKIDIYYSGQMRPLEITLNTNEDVLLLIEMISKIVNVIDFSHKVKI